MRIEKKKIKDLIPASYNPRKISNAELDLLKASMDKYGCVEPIIWNEQTGNIVGGHQRLKVLQAQNVEEIECVIVNLSENDEKDLNIRLNKISGEWDLDKLEIVLNDLQLADFDLSLTGFSEIELNRILKDEIIEDNFDVDTELKQPVFSQAGDLYLLGKHRILCGDSTKAESYERLMDGQKANLLLTDPPYLVNYENKSGQIKNDNLSAEEGYVFLKNAFECFRDNLANDASCYVFYASSKSRIFFDAYEDAGFYVSCGLIWRKNRLILSRTDYQQNFEPIIYGWKKNGKHIWYGDRKQTTCFDFDTLTSSKKEGEGHPTSKPVSLLAYLIRQSTLENDIVLDGFHGSGSTMIACEQLNRRCFAIELDRKFVDIQVRRYIKYHAGYYNDVYVIRNGKQMRFEDIQEINNE